MAIKNGQYSGRTASEAVHHVIVLLAPAPPAPHSPFGRQVAQQAQRANHEAQDGCRGGGGGGGGGEWGQGGAAGGAAHHNLTAADTLETKLPASHPHSPECQVGMLACSPSWCTHLHSAAAQATRSNVSSLVADRGGR